MLILLLVLMASVTASSNTDNKDSYKNQFRSSGHGGKHKEKRESFSADHCTDPRTMKKHAAYTEWADAYSCTRHRCQPGGRNLAIYTVGCKRVEAPESAIECEEVVEDTNMQFPFCCTRLRCLVVVRGEVWTRVLGQPWEVLPAAPWSHMYKMKKPPPADSTFLPKTPDQGPVYELAESDTEQSGHDKVLRSTKKANSDYSEGPLPVERAALPPPDIVIALSTNDLPKESSHTKSYDNSRRNKRRQNVAPPADYFEEYTEKGKLAETKNQEVEELPTTTEKPQAPLEEEHEKFFTNNEYPASEKPTHKSHKTHDQVSWTEIPQNQWNEPKEGADIDIRSNDRNSNYQTQEPQLLQYSEPKQESLQIPVKPPGDKPSNLQALVDAIGSRMRDIENVVQKMSDKVHHAKPPESSIEKRMSAERDVPHKRLKENKRPSAEDENSNYKRFTELKDRASKYLHTYADITTEKPLFLEETNLTGYFSDASNSILRRNNPPKEPPQIYMAPVETRRKAAPQHITLLNNAEDNEKKHKKHAHKKRRGKARAHKKHSRSKDDKRKHFNRLSSGEAEKNAVSLEDSNEVIQ